MQLFYSPTSPYARKVRALIVEKSLQNRVEVIDANPYEAAVTLRAVNPLGKVPALRLADGSCVVDSPVICEYLDGLTAAPRLIPADPQQRIAVLIRQALGDGIMDAAFSLVMERRRPVEQRSPEWMERWAGAILRSVPTLGRTAEGPVDLGDLAIAVALAYLDFRLPDLDWRAQAPALVPWFTAMSARPSLVETAPPA